MNTSEFRTALQGESTYPLTDEIFDFIMSNSEHVALRKNEVLIGYSNYDPDIYFVEEGIIRGSIMNEGGVERTIGFGLCGSIIYSSQCYSMGEGSLISFVACSPMRLLRIRKSDFDKQLDDSHEFCKWFLGSLWLVIAHKDLRTTGLNGDASFKYKWLLEQRPEIIREVPDKIIASYLNITEVHLSRIKSRLLKGQ